MTLENLIREAAAKGLTHFSLYPVWSTDGKTTFWNATATPSTQHSIVKAANYDPVVALTTVLEALPRAPKRAAPKPKFDKENPPLSEFPQRAAQMAADAGIKLEEVTAAVKEAPVNPDLGDGPNDEWDRFK